MRTRSWFQALGVTAALLTSARSLSLTVQSPSPGGGNTTALTFSVDAATGTGTNTNASCVYRCADYGYAPGQCYQNWYCIPNGTYAGCLGQTACN